MDTSLLPVPLCTISSNTYFGDANNSVIVPSRLLEENNLRFHSSLEAAIQSVTNGQSTPETAIANISGDYRDLLGMFRDQLNQQYHNRLEKQQNTYEQQIHHITDEKDREIQELQERIDTLLNASASSSEKENVRRTREQVENNTPEDLVTERQIDRTSRRFSEQLNKIRNEVLEGQRSLEMLLKEHKNDMDRYEDIIEGMTAQFNEKKERMEEAYEQQKSLMQRMIDEITANNLKLEKEKELKTKIGMILSQNCIDPRDIIKSTISDILSMDLPNRYKFLFTLYNEKIQPFSELLESNDLSKLNNYINAINMPSPRTELGDFQKKKQRAVAFLPALIYYINGGEVRRAISYGANIPTNGFQKLGLNNFDWHDLDIFIADPRDDDIIESERQLILKNSYSICVRIKYL
ncbi:hypothetical protein PIROE2DRAFT_5860 [Piromyces sp. E2]|nr:hypothetical protein PIROE2DRAFT_5860 [Piromyces sp. E2]|eukprot:OUM66876.1 hypothetical protein PIROE2DRAFT_5860 [Piromyces sp. E2]